jgi:biofilm PGA synthesis lipoprotein PgaB
MRKTMPVQFLSILAFLALALPSSIYAARIVALSYHDVSDGKAIIERAGITTDQLVSHFDWLHANGYQPVSIQDLVDAEQGLRPLPAKPVLLSFDDGYRSFYTHVFPLLQIYNYPAVLALIGSFMGPGMEEEVEYGGKLISRKEFLSWQQVKEMETSGLVEVASHSYDLHKGILANQQGNLLPAAHVYHYDPINHVYESDASFKERLRKDLQKSSDQILKFTGHRPRVMVWPYGAYSGVSIGLAGSAGMDITLTLDPEVTENTSLRAIPRLLVADDWTIEVFAGHLREYNKAPSPIRLVHVDLDYVWDPDPEVQERNLGLLLDRIKHYHINTVYLQAYSDYDGDSIAEALFFPNRHLPMRADIFGRVAWQLRTRAGVKVFAWLPVMAFEMPDDRLMVKSWNEDSGKIYVDQSKPKRLSPWIPEARKTILEIYEDLSRHAKFGGILFSDDATLSDFEDASPEALKGFSKKAERDLSVAQIRSDEELFSRWTNYKSSYLVALTRELHQIVESYQGTVLTARNLFALPVIAPESKAWFAQDLEEFIASYDQVALMAMPYMEESENPKQWLQQLLDAVQKVDGAMDKVVFEFQTVDWREPGKRIASEEIADTMRDFQRQNAIHFGYYPDDFFNNHPDSAIIYPAFSLQWYPFER